jgi:hypothetical protein
MLPSKTDLGQRFGDDWHDWLRSQILCREAESLLGTRDKNTHHKGTKEPEKRNEVSACLSALRACVVNRLLRKRPVHPRRDPEATLAQQRPSVRCARPAWPGAEDPCTRER